MVKSSVSTHSLPTNADKIWYYDEYYIGDKDVEQRKHGRGENHWTGAESIEWYTGRMVRDTMHGEGDYRWRYSGPDGEFITYEGRFFANQIHGYGVMSYPDGRVFTGLYYCNSRWGPGIERHANLRVNVGFWRGNQLIRLAWRPMAPSVAPDFTAGPMGPEFLEPYRVLLTKKFKIIGETNSAIELLKQEGAEPRRAAEKWTKLYPKHCTDLNSPLCQVNIFENEYYKGKIRTLEEGPSGINMSSNNKEEGDEENREDSGVYFAWNNNSTFIDMMKHCYKHDKQRNKTRVKLEKILSGPRKSMRQAGNHENDCRTLLMASYLGHIPNVTLLVNEHDVHPDIADMQGNTALMYATCGDQADLVHFLVEAGANVNGFNDSCCTPLGVALMRYTCAQKDISANSMLNALLPPKTQPSLPRVENASEWLIDRVLPMPDPDPSILRNSRQTRISSAKKIKSMTAILKKKLEATTTKDEEYDSDESFNEERRAYSTINREFVIRVHKNFTYPGVAAVSYLFTVNDMAHDIDMTESKLTDTKDKNFKKIPSKVMKNGVKPSQDVMWQSPVNDVHGSLDSTEKRRIEMLSRMMLTILQLLADGANPQLVKCPQPALFLAVLCDSPELIRHLVQHGADVNEKYPLSHDYSALDVAVSRSLTETNFEIVKALLECGANTNHRLRYQEDAANAPTAEIPGPTLLHAVLAKKIETDHEADICYQLLDLLLNHNCDPTLQFKGLSAIDYAMIKRMELFEVFVKNPHVDLNVVINSSNQTILVKMFSLDYFKSTSGMDRFPILTNLLLYGADPLLECQDQDVKYGNIFDYAHNNLNIMTFRTSFAQADISKTDNKGKGKPSADIKKTDTKSKISSKSLGKVGEISTYKEGIDLVTECARLLVIRWLQGKLTKELIDVIYKFKHRQWNMILKEHDNKKSTGLWLTAQRCLEIWDILKTTKRKQYNNERVLKHLLCIVQFYQRRLAARQSFMKPPITSVEKNSIDSYVIHLIKEHKVASGLAEEAETWKRLYVKPELVKAVKKFNICFECALPLTETATSIQCVFCKLVSFCTMDCMKTNTGRAGCHPCNEMLINKYFPTPPSSVD